VEQLVLVLLLPVLCYRRRAGYHLWSRERSRGGGGTALV